MNPRPDGDDERLALVSLATRRGRSAWLAAGTLLLGLVVLVSVGAAGRWSGPRGSPAPSAARAVDRATAGPTFPVTLSPAVPDRASRRTTLPFAGYEVDYAADASHRPMLFDDGAVAIYDFGRRAADGTYAGEVHVSVGTPGRGAAVLSHRGFAIVFGTTLDELERAYVRTAPGRIVGRGAGEIDGVPAITLQIEGGPSGVAAVVLAVHGNRAFVLTAAGFLPLYPGGAAVAARAGLDAFTAGFRFGTSLFVSRQLGFQVPLPINAQPFGAALNVRLDHAHGLYVFPDGRRRGDGWSHSIGVSVGTQANPAVVAVLPGASPRPDPLIIWTASLVELQAAYLAAIGGPVGSSATISLGGDLALLIEEPGGLAAAVIAVHHSRVYIISTTGLVGPEAAPDFEEFLAGFVFFD